MAGFEGLTLTIMPACFISNLTALPLQLALHGNLTGPYSLLSEPGSIQTLLQAWAGDPAAAAQLLSAESPHTPAQAASRTSSGALSAGMAGNPSLGSSAELAGVGTVYGVRVSVAGQGSVGAAALLPDADQLANTPEPELREPVATLCGKASRPAEDVASEPCQGAAAVHLDVDGPPGEVIPLLHTTARRRLELQDGRGRSVLLTYRVLRAHGAQHLVIFQV